MVVRGYPATGQRGPPVALLDLQNARTEVHGIIFVHRTLVLQRKDQIEIFASHRQKSMPWLGRS